MYRIILRTAFALLTFGIVTLGIAPVPARADKLDDVCRNPPQANAGLCAAAFNNRCGAHIGKGDFARAIGDCDQAIRFNPNVAVFYGNRCIAYMNNGDYRRAIADCSHAIRLEPAAVFYSSRCAAYQRNHEYDRAVADCTAAIKRDPKPAVFYSNRCAVLADKGDHDAAIADCTEAINRDPKAAVFYNNRGKVYADKGDYERAIADFDAALKLDPAFAVARQQRDSAQDAWRRQDQAKQANQTPPDQAKQPDQAPSAVQAPPNPDVAASAQPRRVALVIGMGDYANVSPLRNPVADARAIADAFRRLRFAEVIEREDLTRAEMEKVLKEFGDKAAESDWAVIYYAGHGIEMNGENYLVPVDARLARAEHVEDETVTLRRVLSKVELARQLRMVILDACRSNPFRMASAEGRSRSIGRGLSPVDPGGGEMVAYAAKGGTTADDGDGEHSPFTQALLTHLETPNVDVRIMFGKVRDSVLARTHNAQEPFTYGSLPGQEFYFKQAGR